MASSAPNAHPLIAAFNVTVLGAIFVFDALTPADNVSVCFAYTIPIVLSLLEDGRRTLLYTAGAVLFSIIGSFIQPPNDQITGVFVMNRLIAIVTQCAMALLVRYRLTMESALQASLDEQRETVERQRHFIAMLSHEIRTPLTVMDGHAYRLIKRGRALSGEDVVTRAQKIRAAAARVNGIITAVLTLTSVGADRIEASFAPVDPRRLLDTVIHGMAEGRPAPIVQDLGDLPDVIVADPLLLTQAFENIIGNAIKYSPEDRPITVAGSAEGAELVVRVADQGSGIAPDDLPKVFTPYFRGGNSRSVPGAGIGLHLVQRFIAAHGGSVSIDSRVGTGTTVTVRLPRIQPEGARKTHV